MGISSILLAEKYGLTVFAADLWISPTENAERFARLGLDRKIIPLSVDATKDMPFAHAYFDMIISEDSYHSFGDNEQTLPRVLPFLKTGGFLAVPGLKQDFPGGAFTPELQPFRAPDVNFYSCGW